jgi:hypothetical protein
MLLFNNVIGNGSASITQVSHAELVALKASAQLKVGQFYRITDYVATTTQEDTMSANHSFDIIVLALDNKTLSEEAKAIQHEGDTYFANSNLNAWKLWYSLDNDKSRFVWADEENGKGVIYRMIDEFNNDVAYDFKGILFVRTTEWFSNNNTWYKNIFEENPQEDKWFYTFSWINENGECKDLSIVGNTLYNDEEYISGVFGNKILEYSNSLLYSDINISLFALSKNIFVSSYLYNGNTFYGCYSNTFGNNCESNTFGNNCYSNTFGNNCYSNTFGKGYISNTFGNNCNENTFGNNCESNTFGNDCNYSTFGNDFSFNTFGNKCNENTFGDNCNSNTFGDNCFSNKFGKGCVYNMFSNFCESNILGNFCSSNRFGNNCKYITFGNDCNSNTFGNDCINIRLLTTNNGIYQFYVFASGLQGIDDTLEITLTPDLEYETYVAKNSSGNLKQGCLADLLS